MFCWVVEEGSVSKAARNGYVSQPAVTKQIRQLENSFGTTLFDRVNGKMVLTDTGELLYPYAKEIIALNKIAYEEIQEGLRAKERTLYIGASLTIGEYLLPALISRYKKNHPNIKFNLSIGNTPRMLGKLELNEIDIALVEGLVPDNKYKLRKFAEDELILIVSHAHRWDSEKGIDLKELLEERMLWREKESGTRFIVEKSLRDLNILDKIDNAMEFGSMQAIKSAVEADLGISILPKLIVKKELKYEILREIPIKDFNLTRNFWMVEKKRKFKSNTLQHFGDFLVRSVANEKNNIF